jgi:hypothetical protein
MMHRADPVHIAIHHKTGEVALIPTKDEHAHLGEKMGLKKTVTYDHLGGEDHGHKNTLGVKLRGPRAKGSTFNASVESSSGAMVDAVRDAGGHVFDSLDHATEHLRSHGWGAETGHAMSESVGLLLQGKYDTRLISEYLVKSIGGAMDRALSARSGETGGDGEDTDETTTEKTAAQQHAEDERKKLIARHGSYENIPDAQKRRIERMESDANERADRIAGQQAERDARRNAMGGSRTDTPPPDPSGEIQADPSVGGSRTDTPPPDPSGVEDAYQSEPIGNLDPVGDETPATTDATPSASYNPAVTGGQVSPSGNVVGVGDPRKRNTPQASAQFQTQGYDFGSMKANFMKESSVKSLLDEILNETNTELNLKGSFGEPVHDKLHDDKAYIRAVLFNAMKKNNK